MKNCYICQLENIVITSYINVYLYCIIFRVFSVKFIEVYLKTFENRLIIDSQLRQ